MSANINGDNTENLDNDPPYRIRRLHPLLMGEQQFQGSKNRRGATTQRIWLEGECSSTGAELLQGECSNSVGVMENLEPVGAIERMGSDETSPSLTIERPSIRRRRRRGIICVLSIELVVKTFLYFTIYN